LHTQRDDLVVRGVAGTRVLRAAGLANFVAVARVRGVLGGVLFGHLIGTCLTIRAARKRRQTGALGAKLIDAIDAVLVEVAAGRRGRQLAGEVLHAAAGAPGGRLAAAPAARVCGGPTARGRCASSTGAASARVASTSAAGRTTRSPAHRHHSAASRVRARAAASAAVREPTAEAGAGRCARESGAGLRACESAGCRASVSVRPAAGNTRRRSSVRASTGDGERERDRPESIARHEDTLPKWARCGNRQMRNASEGALTEQPNLHTDSKMPFNRLGPRTMADNRIFPKRRAHFEPSRALARACPAPKQRPLGGTASKPRAWSTRSQACVAREAAVTFAARACGAAAIVRGARARALQFELELDFPSA